MATILPETQTRDPETSKPELPDASVLHDRVPQWLQAPRVLVGYVVLLGLVFFFFNNQPLWYTDLWGHLAYGQWIWETGALPTTEPLMPLAQGVPMIDTAWLSQLIGYGAVRAFGVTALQLLYGTTITLCAGLLLWRFYSRSRNVGMTLLGFGILTLVNWQQLMIIRPQLAGYLCFIALLIVLTRSRWSRAYWIAIPALFALWANLHGSFPVGLGLLGCFCAGRAVDVLRRTRSFASIFYDDRVRRYFLLAELAAVAVLLNPYGLMLYAEVFSITGSENLMDLVEWEPLQLRMMQGQAAAVAALALVFAYRLSPRRVSAVEVLLLIGFGTAALWTSRMILWWAPLAAYYLVLHGSAAWKRFRRIRTAPEPSPRSGLCTVVTAGLAWIFIALTPFYGAMQGSEVKMDRAVSRFTPLGAVEFLKKNPPKGQVFNTYEWGDYLLWAGPKNMQIFAASHAHLIPTDVWDHYMQIINVESGWDNRLDRYGVNTVVVDHTYRSALINRLKQSEKWRVRYEDDVAVVFVRRKPIL